MNEKGEKAATMEPTDRGLKLLALQQRAAIKRAELAIDFAKFGFRGTLCAAFGGMALMLALAALQAWTPFRLETWGFVGIGILVLAGCIAFGFFSLWSLPRIVARLLKMERAVNPGDLPAAGQAHAP